MICQNSNRPPPSRNNTHENEPDHPDRATAAGVHARRAARRHRHHCPPYFDPAAVAEQRPPAAQRTVCSSNLRQIVAAATLRASGDDPKGVFFPQDDGANDSFAYLYSDYVDDYNVFLCPATRNSVRPDVFMDPIKAKTKYGRSDVLEDVQNNASSAEDETGHSYEVFAWYSLGEWPDGRIVDMWNRADRNLQRGLRAGDPDYYYSDPRKKPVKVSAEIKRFGKLYSPVDAILVLDSDEDSTDAVGNHNNWPDPKNNHGTDGQNMGFGDGHVAFVRPGPEYVDTYLRGYQGLAQPDAFTTEKRPGLTITKRKFSGETGNVYAIN